MPSEPTRRVIIANGRLFVDGYVRNQPIAVEDGRISAIGQEAVDALAPRRTEEIDAGGGLVLPGFQGSHIHVHHAGRDLVTIDLTESDTVEGYLRQIATYARNHPEAEWIRGGGWSMPAFPGGVPTAAMLDAVVSDRPVYLPNSDGHGAWVNSKAMELAGIDAGTPQPADGRIEVDAEGYPVGCLQEGAMELVSRLVPKFTDAELDEGFLRAQRRLLSWGVTAWQDAMVESGERGLDNLASYRRLDASGELIAKVVGCTWWERSRGINRCRIWSPRAMPLPATDSARPG